MLVGHRADLAPRGAGEDDVADVQRAVLHQDARHRALAAIEEGLDDGAGRGRFGFGLKLEHLGLERDHLEQLLDAGTRLGRDLA